MREAEPGNVPPRRRAATVIESVEEIRAQLGRPRLPAAEPRSAQAQPPSPTGPGEDDTEPFRPTLRPPMAVLTAFDDGEDSGETFRIRADSFVIGRVDGDLVIPHDSEISGRHAEIVRTFHEGTFRWLLKDLGSTNGTFVRASTSLLRHSLEFLVGSGRFRFEVGHAPSAVNDAPAGPATTRKWQVMPPEKTAVAPPPTLVELTPRGEGRRFPLNAAEQWIGRDPKRCAIVLDDPMVSSRHLKVWHDERDRWVVSNARALNGLWVRIDEIGLERGGMFQCGEQRFSIKIL